VIVCENPNDGSDMRGLVWDGSALDLVDDLRVRPPGQGEVTVGITTAGLCHSDLKPMDGDIPQQLPVILGHEAVGRIVETGPGTTLRVGQRVVLSVFRACGVCAACRAGRRIACRRTAHPARSPFSREGVTVQQFVRTGAFAERTVVAESQAIPIPDELPDAEAAMLGCATVTAFGAVEQRARVQPGETVLVVGAGGVGLNVVLAARAAGAARIIVCDRNPRKRDIALLCGATDFAVTPAAVDVTETCLGALSEGVDTAFECVGRADLLTAAVESLAWGGRAVIVGLPPTGTDVSLPIRSLFHDKSLLGCRMGSIDPQEALPLLARRALAGEFSLAPLVTRIAPLTEADQLVTDLRKGNLERGFFDMRSVS
jgi:Zn-dependent alcohol dehydrogenase